MINAEAQNIFTVASENETVISVNFSKKLKKHSRITIPSVFLLTYKYQKQFFISSYQNSNPNPTLNTLFFVSYNSYPVDKLKLSETLYFAPSPKLNTP